MKKFSCILFFTSLILISCNSQSQNKIESKNYVQKAEKIFKDNLQYSEKTTSQQALMKSVDYLDKAIELDSTNLNAYQDKVTILKVLKKKSELIDPLVRLLHFKPDFAEGFVSLGAIYDSLKKYDSANLAYKQAQIGFLKRPPSDNRNFNLIFVEFLITKSKKATLEKLKEFDIKDLELKRKLILEINEWEKGNIN